MRRRWRVAERIKVLGLMAALIDAGWADGHTLTICEAVTRAEVMLDEIEARARKRAECAKALASGLPGVGGARG
jgi:hypothetical protein